VKERKEEEVGKGEKIIGTKEGGGRKGEGTKGVSYFGINRSRRKRINSGSRNLKKKSY